LAQIWQTRTDLSSAVDGFSKSLSSLFSASADGPHRTVSEREKAEALHLALNEGERVDWVLQVGATQCRAAGSALVATSHVGCCA
jgi:hypothetical protein